MIKRKYLIINSIAFAVALMLVSSAQASIGLPEYDSGWIGINPGQQIILTHNLGTTDVLVYLIGKNSLEPEYQIHQHHYGGDWQAEGECGVRWRQLTNDTIKVVRMGGDGDWHEIRVMIWKIEAQPQGVGGFWIPVDKINLIAPYVALVSTIILAASISVAYIKYRKKQ